MCLARIGLRDIDLRVGCLSGMERVGYGAYQSTGRLDGRAWGNPGGEAIAILARTAQKNSCFLDL